MYHILRKLYKVIPISHSKKIKLKNTVYKYFPVFFKNTAQYNQWAIEQSSKINFPKNNIINSIPSVDYTKQLNFKIATNPIVSIIIPVYGGVEYTFHCLSSILEINDEVTYEIIIVDDYSPDNTLDVLKNINGIRVIKNKVNCGFVRSCNKAAKEANGKYLLFLNNDTEVKNGWLDELFNTFEDDDVGLVGSKLIYPDGRLQEAGGIIWNDASGWNYGRFDDPYKPEYNYKREVDYCSGASIMVPKDLFISLGCFDERYIPAYYEDVDLAFLIRSHGKKTIYQPLSEVVHFEGISSGTDLSSGTKSYQVINAEKFHNKWKDVLNTHGIPGENRTKECERKIHKRILIVDACTPTPDMDAGSVVITYFIKIMLDFGFKITFIPASNFIPMEKYTADLQRMGVECLYEPYVTDVNKYLSDVGDVFDFVFLYRADWAYKFINSVRKYCPSAKVIFNTVDLHYLRMERQAELEKSSKLKMAAKKIKEQEVSVMERSDFTIILSRKEKQILEAEYNDLNIVHIPLIMDLPGSSEVFEKRKGVLFIGGYNHLPNVDAVKYFVKEIWPGLKEKLPELTFYVLGSNPPDEIVKLECDDIKVIGYVEELSEYFDKCRVSIAPLRYGAGVKGKIATSFSYGVPVVSTEIGIEGMGIEDGVQVLAANNPEKFISQVEKVYTDKNEWEKYSLEGIDFIREHYSIEAGRKRLHALLK